MSNIENFVEKYNNEEQKNSFRYGNIIEFVKYTGGILSFFAIIGTAAVLILKTDKENSDINIHTLINYIFGIAVLSIILNGIFFIVFAYNRKKQHIDIGVVLQMFNALEKDFEEKEHKMDDYLKEIEETSKNLAKAPVTNLISWDTSEEYEKKAKEVWSFSYSLNWLDDKRIEDKCFELLKNHHHRYRYLLAEENETSRNTTINRINCKIIKFDSEHNSEVLKRFNVMSLKTRRVLFPVPNDVSIYQGALSDAIDRDNKLAYNNIVVIATEEIKDTDNRSFRHNRDRIDVEKYDIMFKDEIQVQRVIEWYEDMWNKLEKIKK